MKLIMTLCMLFFSAPAFSGLTIIKQHSTYKIVGDMSSARFKPMGLTHTTMPYGSRVIWPAVSGVTLFVVYNTMSPNKPLLLGPNLQNDDPDFKSTLSMLADRSGAFTNGIVIRPTTLDEIDFIGLYICDYKISANVITHAWVCIGTDTADGSIALPPPPPPPDLICNLSNTIDLRHGNISMDAVLNNKASTTSYISCNRSATVQLSIAPNTQGKVDLNGIAGLKSNLYVEGVGAGKTISINVGVGSRAVKFDSILSSSNRLTAGKFQGSSYVLLSFP